MIQQIAKRTEGSRYVFEVTSDIPTVVPRDVLARYEEHKEHIADGGFHRAIEFGACEA